MCFKGIVFRLVALNHTPVFDFTWWGQLITVAAIGDLLAIRIFDNALASSLPSGK